MVRTSVSSCSNLKSLQHVVKKRGVAAMIALVALATAPVWADTAQEKVIRRLANDTSTGASALKEAIQTGTATSLQTSQSMEQKHEEIRARLHGDTSTSASAMKDATQTGTATSLQTSHSMEQKREEIRARLHGDL